MGEPVLSEAQYHAQQVEVAHLSRTVRDQQAEIERLRGMVSDYTGNTASECPWCGDCHGPQWRCNSDGLRRNVSKLRAALAAANQRLADPHPQRDLVTEHNEALAAKDAEIERLRAERKHVESYLLAVAKCARLHPDGYTIVDFQQVWLDQERAENTRLACERDEAREAARWLYSCALPDAQCDARRDWPWLVE